MENKIHIKTVIKNAKSACKRDGYSQIIYAYDEDDFAFTRLYPELKLFGGVKKVIGIVDGHWSQGHYKVDYISDKDIIDQIVRLEHIIIK